MDYLAFETPEQLSDWLAQNGEVASELWVRIYKKHSQVPSIDWQQCVIECLRWGWIDGIKRKLDAVSYLQRITPRKPRSVWSAINKRHVEALEAAGRMTPAGARAVAAARADGRWEAANAGQANMKIPQDFLDRLDAHPNAKAFYDGLDRANLFAIYHRLQTALTLKTRAARMEKIITQLERGERFH